MDEIGGGTEAAEHAFLAALVPVARAVDAFAASRRPGSAPYVVAVGGGVAVGKSTVAETLGGLVAAGPRRSRVATVSLDSFIRSNAALDAAGLTARKGFPESYDAAALLAFMRAVRAGEAGLQVPVYSHERYDIVPDEHLAVPASDLLVVEGLHALAPLADGSRLGDLGLYVDAPVDVVFGWYITRFQRLLADARDDPASFFYAWRGLTDAESKNFATLAWEHINVVNLEQYIEPTRAAADVIVEKDAAHRITLVDRSGRLA